MKTIAEVIDWEASHPLEPVHIDCAVAVMLKILDGKCKMKNGEKHIMAHLYRAVKGRPGLILGEDINRLIDQADRHLDDALRETIYEKRVLAETMISRPVMKGFKAMIRQQGLFGSVAESALPVAT